MTSLADTAKLPAKLATGGITARVIDLYSVKPLGQAAVTEAAAATRGRLIIAENHYPQAASVPRC